jgi:type IX secretion system PorP/SprF family membrane protein
MFARLKPIRDHSLVRSRLSFNCLPAHSLMTPRRTFSSFIAMMALVFSLQAQDLHFTQFYASPLQLNPAMTGGFLGSVRIGGIYRDQWNYLANVRGYRTPDIYVDAPVITGFRKQDWVGVGANIIQDQAGTAGLTRSAMGLNLAYHLGLGNKSVLAIGAGVSQNSRGIKNRNELLFEDQIVSGSASTDLTGLSDKNISYLDAAAGVNFTTQLNSKMGLKLGTSVSHLLNPEYNLKTTSVAKLPILMAVHGQFDMTMTPQLSLHPQFLFQTIAGSNEMVLQGIAGYKLKPDAPMMLRAGLGYRLRDALQVLMGVDMGPLRAGLAYDVNVSSFTSASGGHGAFELQASYIITIGKTIKVKPVILCPRF